MIFGQNLGILDQKRYTMFKDTTQLAEYIKSYNISFIDLCFTDLFGNLKHNTYSAKSFDVSKIESGVCMGGGFMLKPHLETAFNNPFTTQQTLSIICTAFDNTGNCFDWRSSCVEAEKKISKNLPENPLYYIKLRFFIIDNILYSDEQLNSFYKIDIDELTKNNAKKYEHGNSSQRTQDISMATAPFDSHGEIRNEMVATLQSVGIECFLHRHNEQHGSGEILFQAPNLVTATDYIQIAKYIIRNTASAYGKSVTFMPYIYDKTKVNNIIFMHSIKNDVANSYVQNILNKSKQIALFTSPMSLGANKEVENFEWITTHKQQNDQMFCGYHFIEGISNPYAALTAIAFASDENHTTAEVKPTNNSCLITINEAIKEMEKDTEFIKKFMPIKFLNIFLDKKKIEAKKIASTINPVEFITYYNL